VIFFMVFWGGCRTDQEAEAPRSRSNTRGYLINNGVFYIY
jgi:hypothetical protein